MKKKTLKKILWYVFSTIIAIIFLLPIYIAVTDSFKTQKGLYMDTIGLPTKAVFTLENYVQAFIDLNFFKSFLNSLTITVISTVLIIIFTSITAWVHCKTKDKDE
jgi:raffinose/stachyose/melibiose transport system permease protein